MAAVLGINAYHADSSACFITDGTLVAAAEEERFRRIKHWSGFPSESIRYCLEAAGLSLSQVQHIAVNADPSANLARKILFTAVRRPSPAIVLAGARMRARRGDLQKDLQKSFPSEKFRGEIHKVEHHLAHLGAAYLVSPFDEAVAVSVDGFGDFASTGWGLGRGNLLHLEGRIHFPHSLGIFYETITHHLGFLSYGDEYKVMALASYGRPSRLDAMRSIVRLRDEGRFELDLNYFRHHDRGIEAQWTDCEPRSSGLGSDALAELLGPPRSPSEEVTSRHLDIAHSAQAMYEEALFHLLRHLHSRYRIGALALAGGCALNSVANGKVFRNTSFKRLFVQPAAGDAGGALGAALVTSERVGGAGEARHRFLMDHAQWGPSFGRQAIGQTLASLPMPRGCVTRELSDPDQLCATTARALAAGKVVGWFQGRMEWGPRALGNRSILCDPRRADMARLLNSTIKRREAFRPFAPSILREAVVEWFEIDDEDAFMTKALPVRKEKRGLIPAVVHVDGSARLHAVTRESNPLYYQLIGAFAAITGVPLLLNTSFNENEPIVCRPEEAVDCFLRTSMDVLVLGQFFIERNR